MVPDVVAILKVLNLETNLSLGQAVATISVGICKGLGRIDEGCKTVY